MIFYARLAANMLICEPTLRSHGPYSYVLVPCCPVCL
jgi:hypothetical protein